MIDLLKSRYIAIANDTSENFQKGWIFTEVEDGWITEGCSHILQNPQDYPHLFRPMLWHEKRTPDEMPLYMKWGTKYATPLQVVKVTEWVMDDGYVYFKWRGDDDGRYASIAVPATEAEFLAFKEESK